MPAILTAIVEEGHFWMSVCRPKYRPLRHRRTCMRAGVLKKASLRLAISQFSPQPLCLSQQHNVAKNLKLTQVACLLRFFDRMTGSREETRAKPWSCISHPNRRRLAWWVPHTPNHDGATYLGNELWLLLLPTASNNASMLILWTMLKPSS